MHAIKVLREDHARIEVLLKEMDDVAEDGQATKGKVFERLEKELTVHILAEDNIFLPHVEDAIEDSKKATTEFFDENVRVLDEATGLIAQSYQNHREITALLEDTRDVESANIDGRSSELRRAVALQIEREEELFPMAEKVLEEEDFERIGNLVEHCKWQVRGLAQAKLASSSSFQPSEREVPSLLRKKFQKSKLQ